PQRVLKKSPVAMAASAGRDRAAGWGRSGRAAFPGRELRARRPPHLVGGVIPFLGTYRFSGTRRFIETPGFGGPLPNPQITPWLRTRARIGSVSSPRVPSRGTTNNTNNTNNGIRVQGSGG